VSWDWGCAICSEPIEPVDYRAARVWTDPGGNTCAAHDRCLCRVGEYDLKIGDWGLGPV
jgi:hypothetical protein